MKHKLLDKFKTRFNLDDDFIDIVASLFDKLLSFGYISGRLRNILLEKLNDNIDYLFFGTDSKHDYKSGFYDADKKTMYIQDRTNISSIYLRLIYAITSSEIDLNTHNMGFSTTYMLDDSYKLTERNFALNRAVIANLVCRLTGCSKSTIQLVPCYKSYCHNFFGYEILADNDIYSFEGRILSQMCFSTGINEEVFYSYLFSKSPVDNMNKMFSRTKFIDRIKFLTLFDNTSRKYSTYCKLNYFSNLLNKNYIERRKNNISEKQIIDLEAIEAKVSKSIKSIVRTFDKRNNDVVKTPYYELEGGLTATLEILEKDIINNTIKMQDILASNIITGISYLSPYLYANKLKEFNSLVIMPNKKLDDAIYNTIMFKLIPDHEVATTNIIQKIRYCLVSNILETEKLTNVSSAIVFYKIEDEIEEANSEVTILTVNNIFAGIVKIADISKDISALKNNTINIKSNNLNYIKNNDIAGKSSEKIKNIFCYLKSYFMHLKKVSLNDVFIFDISSKEYILVNTNKNIFLFEITEAENGKYTLSPVQLSTGFSLFDLKRKNKSSLPVLYKENKRKLGFFGV